jgi:hypothetical protein
MIAADLSIKAPNGIVKHARILDPEDTEGEDGLMNCQSLWTRLRSGLERVQAAVIAVTWDCTSKSVRAVAELLPSID